jgi:hypothetical protein
MQSIDLLPIQDFQSALLETFVPLSVQRRAPRIKDVWRELLSLPDIDEAVHRSLDNVLNLEIGVAEYTLMSLANDDADIMMIKNALYATMGEDEALIAALFNRPVTDGNEQCPFWDNQRYTELPKMFTIHS